MQPKIKCLIIDDDRDDQEIFIMCAGQVNENLQCAAFSDPAAAVETLQADASYTPDYIFVDMNMPKMNGIQCLGKLRAIQRLCATQIFMYSTTSEKNTLSESQRLGANGFIIKPTKTADLRARLTAIFATASS